VLVRLCAATSLVAECSVLIKPVADSVMSSQQPALQDCLQDFMLRSMKFLSMKWIVPLILLAAFYVGDQVRLGRPDHKYRLTIEVETPDGPKFASGVVSVHPNRSYGGSGSGGSGPRTRGDAVVADLGAGKALVALLAVGDNPIDFDASSFLALRAITAAGNPISFREVKNLADASPVLVTAAVMPVLLTFADIADPATARLVAHGDLEAAFGKGYRVRAVQLAVVANGFWPIDFGGALGEPITRGIEERMSWLKTKGGAEAALRAAGLKPGSGFAAKDAFTRP
jgi:hypothetical protein